jgi:hypothetical protein
MEREPPRLGPWLRRYAEEEKPDRRQRAIELGLTAVAGLVVLGGAVGVVWLFIRWPLWTGGGLVMLWGVGFTILVIKRRAAAERDRRLRELLESDDR